MRLQRPILLLLLLLGLAISCKRSAPEPPQTTNAPGAAGTAPGSSAPPAALPDQYISLMNAGRNHLEQGDATNALVTYRKAAALVPQDPDVHLNLANAHLIANATADAVRETDEVLKYDPNSAAAYFVQGSAHLRASNAEAAVKAFENANRIEPGVTATLFQLGLARTGLKQWDAAIAAFREGIRLDPNRLHSTAHYLLGQALMRVGKVEEARRELEQHQANVDAGGVPMGGATFERSKYTQARIPFKLDQPGSEGILVRFVDSTGEMLGAAAKDYAGPIAVLDPGHKGANGLFVLDRSGGTPRFQLLSNTNGTFQRFGPSHPAIPGAEYQRALSGDLQNDRFDDIVVLGSQGSHVFRFETNGLSTDATSTSGLGGLKATDGLLVDLDFTGKLDLLVAGADGSGPRLFRQFGPLSFRDITRTSGLPTKVTGLQSVAIDDWNRDGSADVFLGRTGTGPLLLEKKRGGPLVPQAMPDWPPGAVFCVADFNNDLRTDLAVVSGDRLVIAFNGGGRLEAQLPAGAKAVDIRRLVAFDHDQDGWLDLWAIGAGLRVWRNLGMTGFRDDTARLGLDNFGGGGVISDIRFADFDSDCDTDVVVAVEGGGLRCLRNDGGNANGLVKVNMVGNRSNANGIGSRIEIETGGLRLTRTVRQLPVEIGVGRHQMLDSFLVHWFNWPQGSAEVPFNCREPLLALELTIQEGSCPFLYAWDGQRFEFITDILGAAPLGLPVAEGRYIESDPEELVRIGDDSSFPAREGFREVRITEELREVLYLDEAKLVVVDRDPGTEVHSTDKLLPGGPFPPGELITLHRPHPLLRATGLDGRDVTAALQSVDGRRASSPHLRTPQLRGLAEPHGWVLDFGPLDTTRPLVLVLNGWLRFGGGMANIAASHDPALPFPFPRLEAEVTPGDWKPVDVVVGAPAGKTKTIVVDLAGKLPAGTRRLRLSEAFEIHWDRVALLERQPDARTSVTRVAPASADLRFRGFSPMKDLPADWPLTPDYSRVEPNSYWTVIPGGWCTRYGDVMELVGQRDEGLALIHSGDELSLKFDERSLPPRPAGTIREYFLYVDGWDKDSDFHVAAGTEIGPLPYHGMDDQGYAHMQRPKFPSDALHARYNTRWVDSRALRQMVRR